MVTPQRQTAPQPAALKHFLLDLHRDGIRLHADNGRLLTRAAPGAITPAIGQRIRDNKDALLQLLATLDSAGEAAPAAAIAARPAHARPALSFAQQRLWFIDQVEGSRQYHMPVALELDGILDAGALQAALAQLVARHEVLRTTYDSAGGAPWQQIGAATPVLVRHDLRPLAAVAQHDALAALTAAAAAAPFDLRRDSVLRAALVALSDTRNVLLLTLHHIACDGWSMAIIVRELGALYAALCGGRPAPLAPLPVQYADYAHWQRSQAGDARLARQCDYWTARLAHLPLVHGLPLDHPRPPRQDGAGRLHRQTLAPSLLARLKLLAGARGATLFMVLHSAFALLLARWSGSTDIVIGTPIAGRVHRDLEGLVGLFVNTLVLRTAVDLEQPFGALLAQGKAALLDAYAHQELPFEKLVDAIKPERSSAHAPLFQIMFSMQNAGQGAGTGELALPGLAMKVLGAAGAVTRFDLELAASEGPGGLALDWNHAAALFDAATIARMADCFAVLLEAIAATPDAAAAALPLLAPADCRLLDGWSAAPAAATAAGVCIHARFEAHAARRPQAVALRHADGDLSYGELNRRANQVAHRLLALGVRPDTVVGLCAERSPDLVVGMLAILKAGGAYVPFDPAYPAARLAYLIEDSAVALVLTQTPLLPLLAALPVAAPATLCLDQADQFVQAPAHDPDAAQLGLHADHLAHLIYTSGSSGQPKGALIAHRGVDRLVRPGGPLGFDHASVTLQMSSPSFDAATFEIWGPLSNGGSVVLYPAGPLDLQHVNRLVDGQGVDTLFLTSGLFDQWSTRLPAGATLRLVMAGGDVVGTAPVARVRQGLPHVRLLNLYGPTEATSLTTWFEVPADWPQGRALPLGVPFPDTLLAVCDSLGNPVPPGVPGELWIGGAGVARGYWGRDEQTLRAFPHWRGSRWYRTGDQVRRRADGVLEFIGRIDAQVKLRGFRIELEEIEAALLAGGDLGAACAVVRGDGAAQQLLAYVACIPGSAADGLAPAALDLLLRDRLRATLPGHMVPALHVALAALPLTANGKLDRHRLRALAPPATPGGVAPQAPHTPLQQRLAAVWAEVLPSAAIGIDDSFFALGGNSITLIELKFRLQQAGIEIDLKVLMEQPTIAALAQWLQRDAATGADTGADRRCLVRLNRHPGAGALYVIHPFGGGVEGYRALALALAPVCPVVGVQAPFMYGEDFSFDTPDQLARLYADAILADTAGAAGAPCALAGYSGGGKLAVLVAQMLEQAGRRVPYLALFDTNVVDPDRQPDEDDYVRLSRFCYSLHIVNAASDVPADWRALPYDQQLDRFAGLVLARRAYQRDAVLTTLKFGVNLLRSDQPLPPVAALAATVHAFGSATNPALRHNTASWTAMFAGPLQCHAVDADHNHFMEDRAVRQMLPLLAQGLARIAA